MNYPNIVYIHSHDTGRYIQPYGYSVPTPHLQRLAEQGVLFRQAFCQAPTCSPSRAALLTGQAAHSAGMLGLAHRGWGLRNYSQHIIHTLRRAGYRSVLAGAQHVAAGPEAATIIGYDERLATGPARAENVAPAAVQWLQNAPSQPFFLDAGFTETHVHPHDSRFGGDSLFGCKPGDARYVRPPSPLPDTPQTRQDMADYCESARVLDSGIGRVLQALEDNGLSDNTLVICTTDHGLPLPGLKCNLTDHGMGVMLILRGPGVFSGGQVYESLVSHIDIFPTLCDWLNLPRPAWLQGRSMLPLLHGETTEINDAVFGEVTYHAAYQPQRAVRTQHWKYIRQFDERRAPVLPNTDDSRSKELWEQNGWREREVAPEQLFDLLFDPNEANNLAEDTRFTTVLDTMRTRLEKWMHETDDPLLQGTIPTPPGLIETDRDSYSPGTRRLFT